MTHTRVLALNPAHPDPATIADAASIIRAGGLVAFPTETVYGLGADARDETAVQRIFNAKGRDPDDPLIVHIAAMVELAGVCREIPEVARRLAERFWPGGLTLVLPRNSAIAPAVSAGRDTVAVRMPRHPTALALIEAAGRPIAAPSANRFMRTSATTARHVLDDLDGRIDLVLDGGRADAGIESTVVRFDGERVVVLRPGVVTLEELQSVLGPRVSMAATGARATSGSPGMLDRHYAPTARLLYLPDEPLAEVLTRATAEMEGGKRVGLLLADEDMPGVEQQGFIVERLGPAADLDVIAGRLFAALRTLDAAGIDVIVARGFPLTGRGLAIDDRLKKSVDAGGIVIVAVRCATLDRDMTWEGRARKLEAKRQYMRKHGYSVFVMEAAERKRVSEGKASAPSRSGKVSRRTARRSHRS